MSSTDSFFVKVVGSLLEKGLVSAKILEDGLKVVVGCSDKACFWEDIRWDGVPLKSVFPMIFALAKVKGGVIKKFGNWIGSSWEWNVPLRRHLFDWEIDQWNSFRFSLDKAIL